MQSIASDANDGDKKTAWQKSRKEQRIQASEEILRGLGVGQSDLPLFPMRIFFSRLVSPP
jgi:hypothetical protein